LEYFIDTDPGLGLGTHVPLPSIDTVDINFNLNISNLSDGLHTLYIRSINNFGFWSFVQKHIFFKAGDISNDITQMEYFIDTDPGIENATPVSIVPGDTIDVNFTVNLMGIIPGVHTLYVRSRKTNGFWSVTQSKPFLVYSNTLHLEITALEYFYDIDPGPGNGIPISISPNDTLDVAATLSLSGLTVGTHKLNIRGLDTNNHWSHIWAGNITVTETDNLFPVISTYPTSITLSAEDCITPDTSGFYIINSGSNTLNANLSESLSWLTISPLQVGVPAGDSVWITTIATPSSSVPATNVGTIAITNNSQNVPTLNRSVTFNVPQGMYSMTVSHNTLTLPTLQVNQTASGSIILTNTSCSSIVIDSIVHSNGLFSNDTLVSNVPTTISGYTYLGYYNGHSYFKSNATSTWLAAESSVNILMGQMGLSGYMVSINTSEENTWLTQIGDDANWIGIRDSDGSGNVFPCEANSSSNAQIFCWKCSDGTSIEQNNFSAWYPGEPNNAGGNEDFVSLYGNGNPNVSARGKWNDSNGTTGFKHILEIAGGFPPGGTKTLVVNFESPTIGAYTDTMYIYSQAGLDTVIVHAEAVGVPQLAFETDTVTVDFIMCAMDTLLTQKIYNNGGGPLHYQVSNLAGLPSFISIINAADTVAVNDSTMIIVQLENVTLPNGIYHYPIILSTNDTIHFLDTFMISIAVMGQAMITTSVSTLSFGPIPRNTLQAKPITITNSGCQPISISNVTTGTANFIDNISSIYLPPYQSFTANVRFQPPLTGTYLDTLTIIGDVDTAYVVLQGTASGALTFELESFVSNVNIQNCMGMTMDTITLYNVGDGEGSFNISNASAFPSWLDVSPQSGSIPESDSIYLILSYDAMSLNNAHYSQNIIINTSDPITPSVSLLANMFIVGAPTATLDKDTIDYGFTYWTTTKMDSLTITNTGCDTFEIKSINIAAPFLATPTVLNVLPGGTGKIFVTYDPAAIGNDNYIMQINAETDTINVMLMGNAVEYPTITKATKDSLFISMPSPIDAATVNAANLIVWGEQSGRRTGTYSVIDSLIHFIPDQPFFAGEEVSYTLTKNVKYNNGTFVQPYNDSRKAKVWHVTTGDFVIRPTNVNLGVAAISQNTELIIADFDRDGKLDISVKYYPSNGANTTTKIFKQNSLNLLSEISTTTSTTYSVLNGTPDFNNDGKPDLFIAHNTPSQLQVTLNNGSGGFGSPVYYTSTLSNGGRFGDWDNDGDIDMMSISGTNSLPSNALNFFRNSGSSSMTSLQNVVTGVFGLGGLALDYDKDGYRDLIFNSANSYSSLARLRKYKNSFGYFALQTDVANTGNQFYYTSGQFTNDEFPDYILQGGTGIDIVKNIAFNDENTTNITAPLGTPFTISGWNVSFGYQMAIGDLDGDHDQDILLNNNYDGTAWHKNPYRTLKNDGDGTFTNTQKSYNLGYTNPSPWVQPHQLADFDNDGDLDFAFLDAQGRLWIAYNEDSNAMIALSQDTISATYTTCTNINTYTKTISNAGDSTLVWQINLPNTIPAWMDIDTTYGQIPGNNNANFHVHINTTGLLQGSYSYDLIFNSNAINKVQDTLRIQFTITNDSIVLVSANSLDFGLVDIQVNKTLPITITNPGCAPINLTGSLSDGTAYSFSGAPVIVPAFGSKVVNVTLNTTNSGFVYLDTITFSHDYGSFMIPLQAQGCYVSPTTNLYEQVCLASEVGIDSTLYQNISGCDSLVVTHYQLPNTVSNEGLVAYYPFNGNANDESGNNLNGNLMNAPLFVDGIVGQSVRLVGQGIEGASGQNVLLPDYNLDQLNQFSISIWVNEEGMTYDQGTGYFSNGSHGGNQILIAHFGNSINFTVGQVGFNTQFSGLNTWVHYALTYSSFDTMSCYRNGILLNKSYSPGGNTISNTGLGRHWWNNGNNTSTRFIGKIDELKIYNRCLSFEEVQNLAQTGNATSTNYTYSQTCTPIDVGLDTTILAGANQYGCDSTIINFTALSSPVSNEGLVAYYAFDCNTQDMSGWGRNATVSGATLTTDRHGETNAAYSFDGVDDYIRKTNISSINFNNGDEMSVSFWIKPSKLGGQYQDIIANRNGGQDYNWIVYQHADGGEISLHGVQQYKSSFIPQLNSWTHIIFTVNSARTSRLYVNGVIVDSILNYNYGNSFPGVLSIGNFPNAEHYKGQLDDILLFDRVLTSSEIQALYNEQQSYFINTFTTCDTTALGVDTTTYIGPNGCEVTDINITSLQSPISNQGLVAYYKLDGDVKDGSGYGNSGTLFGAVSSNDRWDQSSSSLYFDGVNDYGEVNHSASLNDYLTTGELTISYWINPEIGSTTRDLIAKRPITDNGGFVVQANANQMGYDHVIFTNSGSKYVVIPYTQNQWQHISFTAKQNDAIRVYKNGILAGSLSLAGNTFVGTNSNMRLMANTMALELFQKGNLDEVMIHNRVLSASEIISLYNQHLIYVQSCDIADIGRDTIVTTSSTACDSIQNIVTSLQSPVSSQDLVAYYSFDGTAQDMSGWGNHGTVNGATLTTDRDGNANSAYSFDGNDWMTMPLYSLQGLSGMTKGSFSSWAYFTTNGQEAIIDKTTTGTKNYFQLIKDSNNKLRLLMDNPSTTSINMTSSATLTLNTWHHCSVVWDGSSVKMYVNGILENSANIAADIDVNSVAVLLGKVENNTAFLNGKLDDVRTYSRALSDAEIQALYLTYAFLYTNTISSCDPIDVGQDTTYFAGGSNGCDSTVVTITSLQSPVTNSGLAAYYTMDGNANDFSGYGRNATITGATLTQDRHGNANRAFAFNGNNQYLSTNHDQNLNPGSLSYGVSLHFKTNATGQRELFMKTSVGVQEFFSIQQSGGNIIAQLVKGSTTYTCSTTGLTINDNVWHHVFFQRAPGTIKDTLRLYIDGVLKKQEIYGSVLSVHPQEKMFIAISKNWNGGGLQFPFLGSIDGVMVWNRTLSLAEIQSLAYERKGGPQTLVQRDTTYDYGIVMVGEAPVFSTFITNTTCDTLTINNIYTTNSAFTSNTPASAILPYASQKIDVSFTPAAEVPYAGELKVESASDTLTFYLTGNGCNLCACPTENVVLTTQNGLDAFVAYYGGCDSLPVSLTLAGTSGITNINGLNFIKHIDGNLTINGHTALTNINGFGNLLGLTGSLSVTNNTLLSHIDSLHELSYIGQSLIIQNNNGLSNLFGLRNVDSIGQHITITNNVALNDCDAICPAWNNGISGTLTIANNPSECSTVTQFKMVCDDDCTIGNLILTTQAEVNTFVNTYHTCDTLIGNLTISGGSNINNIHGLSFIKQISGNLTLSGNTNLINMKGLQGLIKLTGNLTITGHPNLVSLDSLHHLAVVSGTLSIQNNPVLNEINALSSLDTIGGNLNINNNITLYNCSGICNVINNDAILGTVNIINNPNNCSTTEEVTIYCTPPVCPVSGNYILKNQAEVNAFVSSFSICDSLIGNLTIFGGNDILNIDGLNFIKYISGNLTIKNNYKISNMQGFSNLQKVGGFLSVEGNILVNSLAHLDSLTYIGGLLRIQNNNAIPNLNGLQYLDHIGQNLIVRNNNVLTNCSVICTLIENNVINGVIDVASNPSPCSNNNQVNTVCTYGSLLSTVFVNITQDSIAEGSTFTFVVSTDYPPSDTLTIHLSSNNQADVPVPATVKILPNTTSVNVTMTLPNDNIPEKQKGITITGGAPYLTSGSDSFILTDNADMPVIHLVITLDTISEGAGLFATPAIISRAFTDGTTMNITLTSSHPALAILPTGVNLAPNELQKQIFIGVADNVNVDTLRKVTITARYIIPSCVCPAPDNSQGVARDILYVSDDDGPTLTISVNPLSMEEGKVNAGTLSISRNTATNVPLTVNLSHNDPTELSLPATAIFLIGAASINVPITTLNDPIEDGNQTVTITVSSPGFVSATTWAIVTDINKPDLIITSLESLDPQLTLGEQMPYKVYIHNKGLSASARGIVIVGYLSKDGSISNDDLLLGNYFMDIAIPAGDTVVFGGTGNLPTTPGTYYLIFSVNPNQTITELLYLNNTSAPLQINVLPNYTATANVNKDVYYIGEPVIISGSSFDLQGQKLPNKAVEIYVLTGNHRREIDVVTNAQGDYIYTLQHLQSEMGHFTVGASYPDLGLTTAQDAYNIVGVRLNNGNFITWNMMLGDTINGNLSVRNLAQVTINNVTLSPQNLPNGCILTFDTLATLQGNATQFLPYRVIASALTQGTEYIQIPLNIHANDTIIQKDKAYYFVKAQTGHLKASITNINTQLGPVAKKVIEFEIENIGQGVISEVNISVPNVTWLRLVSAPQITNMLSGQKRIVTLEFIPTTQLPFNTPATGNIAINTTNANGVSIPFSVMKVGDMTGSITIDVINQFTYFSPGAPHLDSARVRITNYFTGQLHAEGLTGADGKFVANNLPEGQLRIVVEKIRHKSYDGVINVSPGTNQTEVVFLEFQAISFSWDVTSTEIEDEYEIDLIMNFESNIPVPVVTMVMPDTLPKLIGDQTFAFNITMTNVGLITAKEVQLDLPDDIEYEFITTYQPQDILAQQAIQVPVVMRRRSTGGNFNGEDEVQNRIKVNENVIREAEQRLNFKKN